MVRSHRRGRATAGDSADYLVAHRGDLAQFEDMAHLASSTDLHYAMPGTTDAQVAAARRLGHHLVVVRAALAEELWTRQIFVDTEVLDELLYWSVRDPDINDLEGHCRRRTSASRIAHLLERAAVVDVDPQDVAQALRRPSVHAVHPQGPLSVRCRARPCCRRAGRVGHSGDPDDPSARYPWMEDARRRGRACSGFPSEAGRRHSRTPRNPSSGDCMLTSTPTSSRPRSARSPPWERRRRRRYERRSGLGRDCRTAGAMTRRPSPTSIPARIPGR